MITKYVLPLIAACGVVMAIITVRASNPEKAPTLPVGDAPVSKFANSVFGAGLIEASTENIAVGTQVPGVVTEVMAQVNQRVKAGEPLFKIDDRNLRSQFAIQKAQLESAMKELRKLEQSPRQEDLPPLEARVAATRAQLSNAQRELDRLTKIGDSARSDEQDRAKWDAANATANLAAAEAELARMKAGAWKPDMEIAQAGVDLAAARLKSIEVELERLVVTAPVDGTVMQVKIRRGEFASAGPLATPLMLIGNLDTLHVRVDVDENDSWRVQPNAKASATVRGNGKLRTDLTFVRIEPYIVPKRSLTGESNERVDTRVLQVVYAFDANAFEKQHGVRVYAGQQMDVFIEVTPPAK